MKFTLVKGKKRYFNCTFRVQGFEFLGFFINETAIGARFIYRGEEPVILEGEVCEIVHDSGVIITKFAISKAIFMKYDLLEIIISGPSLYTLNLE